MSADRERLEAIVHGVVQGVGFRWFVTRVASRLDLTGWVANEVDGAVRVVAEGSPARLEELEAAIRTGPSGAVVERVETWRQPARGAFTRFEVRTGHHSGD